MIEGHESQIENRPTEIKPILVQKMIEFDDKRVPIRLFSYIPEEYHTATPPTGTPNATLS